MAAGRNDSAAAAVERKRRNHPSHLHKLVKVDVRDIYAGFKALWRCDLCQRTFDGRKTSEGKLEGEADHKQAHHCALCQFDVCSQCFEGYLHAFHHHRLRRARAPLIYQETEGQWKCDGCCRIFSDCSPSDRHCNHCSECEVDLCAACFSEGWSHTLHNRPGHRLKPADSRLLYREFTAWECDHCGTSHTIGKNLQVLFHCSECGDFDICAKCFIGEKNHLHEHKMVRVRGNQDLHSQPNTMTCSNCYRQVGSNSKDHHYHCTRPQCHFTICRNCISLPAPIHPYHPAHPLERCEPSQIYPQSGGLWHCDNCTVNHPDSKPTTLHHSEVMYHCEECEYDLCENCYQDGLKPEKKPIPVEQGKDDSVYQPFSSLGYPRESQHSAQKMMTGAQPSLSYLTSPFIPPHRVCLVCHTSTARMTLVHGTTPHSGPPLCCQSCAAELLYYRRPCPACGLLPDGVIDVLKN